MSSDNIEAERQEMQEENDELQDEEQFEKSEEFENQGFEYDAPLDPDSEHTYSEGHPEEVAAQEAEAEADNKAETKQQKSSSSAATTTTTTTTTTSTKKRP